MDWSIAAAYVAAGVALIVGSLGPLISSRTARQTLEAQRKLANAERLWQRRADAYVALLEWAGETRNAGGATTLDDPPAMKKLADGLRIPLNLEARLTAYASGAVYVAARYFLQGVQTSLHVNADLLVVAANQPPRLQLDQLTRLARSAALESDRLADKMAQLVSDDLHDVLPNDAGRPTLP